MGPRAPRRIQPGAEAAPRSDPQADLRGAIGEYEPLRLIVVEPGADSALWAKLIQRYQCLGCRLLLGAQSRHWVRSQRTGDRVPACVQWTSAAWKMAVCDRWTGWSAEQRARNLSCVPNNSRLLILPWVRVKGLASTILGHCARQLPDDWQRRYGCPPLLLETLVDAKRFRGTCYRAANWIYVGQTAGRGRMEREHKTHAQAIKDIYVYPLVRDARQRLCGDPTR